MLDNTHPNFYHPKQNYTIWRYMDFTKLLSLLEDKSLFFSRSDKFEDPYEGAWTKPSIDSLKERFSKGELPKKILERFIETIELEKTRMFINCWFISENESAAMWDLYLQSPEGIAIKSDHEALSKAIEKSKLIGRTSMVKYINYDTTYIPTGNLFFPFLHKRSSFSHEKELRAIFWSEEDINKSHFNNDQTFLNLDIEPTELIKEIYVSPRAPKWFGELVGKVLSRYELNIPIIKSGLYERPIY
ncbi:hypothetical protein [Winogradskyella algicola]|uniref:hypothetical protein n=1 Tax=Winogradskyella algicola TaxID=2575815 RepID=UPI0011085FB5|nr:hypothetical protein [Winogradskyella algicola]